MSNSSTAGSRGFELPLLLLLGFRTLIDELHVRLAAAGHPDARPMHGFVLQAIGPSGATAVQVGARLGVSKQAAGKLIAVLEDGGYVTRRADGADARRKLIANTEHGRDLLERSAEIFDDLRDEWTATLGEQRVAALESDLRRVTSGAAGRLLDIPGWFSR